MGYSIIVPSSASISLGDINEIKRHAIFAATNDITIEGEFTVENGSYFLAHITACESAWDANRTINLDSIKIIDSLEAIIENDSTISQRVMNTRLGTFNIDNAFVQIKPYYNSAKIISNNEKIVEIVVVDLLGKVLFKENNIFLNEYIIDKQFHHDSGMYLIRVNGTQNIHVQKIWLENEY
jgi:hypothetical protein